MKKFQKWRDSKIKPQRDSLQTNDLEPETSIQPSKNSIKRQFTVTQSKDGVSNSGARLITDLPQDVLMTIVKNLPKDDTLVAFMLTCKTFYNLLQEDHAWAQSCLAVHDHVLPPVILRALLCMSKTNLLTSINFSGNVSITDPLLSYLSENFPCITTVNVSGCQQVSDAGLVKLSNGLNKLISLDVSHTYNITCIALKQVCLKHKWTISSLNLSQAVGLLEKFENVPDVATLPTLCINLKQLVYRWDRSMGHDHRIYNLNLNYLFQCCTHLSMVEISGCNLESNLSQGLRSKLKAAELTSLTLNNDGLSDASLMAILTGVSALEYLNISHGHRLTSYGLRKLRLIPSMQKIKELNVSHCYNVNNDVVRSILQLSVIKNLSLAFCHWVDDDSLLYIAQTATLCYVDISGTSLTKHMFEILKQESQGCLIIKAEDCPYNTPQTQHFREVSLPNLEDLHHVVPLIASDDEEEGSE